MIIKICWPALKSFISARVFYFPAYSFMSITFVEQFDSVLNLIRQVQQRALRAVNAELVDLYWRVEQYVSDKIAQAEWGDATVQELANHLRQKEPTLRGFDRRNLYRMR